MSQNNTIPPYSEWPEYFSESATWNIPRNEKRSIKCKAEPDSADPPEPEGEKRHQNPAHQKAVRKWRRKVTFLAIAFIAAFLLVIFVPILIIPIVFVEACEETVNVTLNGNGFAAIVAAVASIAMGAGAIMYERTHPDQKTLPITRLAAFAPGTILLIILFCYVSAHTVFAACQLRYACEKTKASKPVPAAPAAQEQTPVPIKYPLGYFLFETQSNDPVVIKDNIIFTVNENSRNDKRSGPPSREDLNGAFASLCEAAHATIYLWYFNRFIKVRERYYSGEASRLEWIAALEEWEYALDKKIIPKAEAADKALKESGNQRLTAVRYREQGETQAALNNYAGALLSYRSSIESAVNAFYSTAIEGPEYGNIGLAIDEIINSYGRILAYEQGFASIGEKEIEQINLIIEAYRLVKLELAS